MIGLDGIAETAEYRVALIVPESREVLALAGLGAYEWPLVEVPRWARQAQALQKAIMEKWSVHSIILDFLPSVESDCIVVVAQVLSHEKCNGLESIKMASVSEPALEEAQRAALARVSNGDDDGRGAFTQLGWIDKAIAWVESETGSRLASRCAIEQYNAGGRFSLIRFRTHAGHSYWMKAAGDPNAHELSVTTYLARSAEAFLPRVIATKPEWSAWLTSGDDPSLADTWTLPKPGATNLALAVTSMARLQRELSGRREEMLHAGAFDQGADVLLKRSEELFDHIAESMALQVSTKSVPLSRARIQELRMVVVALIEAARCLCTNDSVIHGDLNPGNVLIGTNGCRFIDWAETYVGNPLISLQNLMLLNRNVRAEVRGSVDQQLKTRYIQEWSGFCDPKHIEKAMIYMPALAIVSDLYGRGDWLNTSARNDPRRRSYVRTLARALDRAVCSMCYEEALCR
jgi:hypothetical protein